MPRYLLLSLLWISLAACAQTATGPDSTARYTAYIEMPCAYVSGVCILHHSGDTIRGSLFNEFGITALDFTYLRSRDRVRLHNVIKMMDRWYIRRQLRRDLRQLMHRLDQGESSYCNERHHITYTLTPL